MSKIKHWKKGTGSYKIGEINIKQGELIPNGVALIDSNSDGLADGINDNTKWTYSIIENENGFIRAQRQVATTTNNGYTIIDLDTTINKTYKISFKYRSNVPIVIKFSGNHFSPINTGTAKEETLIINNYNGDNKTYIGIYGEEHIDDFIEFGEFRFVEIPPLPELDNGTKYLENTTPGTTALQSKQAYGEWEFDLYKDSLDYDISFISQDIIDAVNGSNYHFRIATATNNRFELQKRVSGAYTLLFKSPENYLDDDTWYGLKVARLQSEGVFKDIPTLQISDLVNSTVYPYTSFTSNGRYGFRAISDGNGTQGAMTVDEITTTTSSKLLIEFDLKLNSGALPNLIFINGLVSASQNAVEGRNSMIFDITSGGTGSLFFRSLSTAADYEVSGLTIRRIYESDTFAVFIKGGDFGDDWTLIDTTGGSGPNPVKDSTYKTSNYFVADLDAGDRLANLKIYDGVEQ